MCDSKRGEDRVLDVEIYDKLPEGAFMLKSGDQAVGVLNGQIIGPNNPDEIRKEMWKIVNRNNE